MAQLEHFHRGLIDGSDHRIRAALLRKCLSIAEPFYAIATTARNQMFDRGTIASQHVGRAVVSVGNITTGGTGKTPVVRWLVESLRSAGRHPAILMRGYKTGADTDSDEQRLFESQLPGVPVEANPSRVHGAREVLAVYPQIDVFVLDDGFQHRKIHRDLDIVLIDASNPFGFEHVLPRGLLREPLDGLARAGAFLITHTELANAESLRRIESALQRYNASAPIYRCRHVQTGMRDSNNTLISMDAMKSQRIFAFCGIGNPSAFERQLRWRGQNVVGTKWLGDHHSYTAEDLKNLSQDAKSSGAEVLVTTEKDWVKLEPILGSFSFSPPIHRVELSIEFDDQHERRLLDQVLSSIARSSGK